MIQIIVGAKGKGKTKILLDKVNSSILDAKGTIVYLDKSSKNMYELNNHIRLIDVTEYCVENSQEFVGFLCGLISQDHDLEKIYLDSFMKIACIAEGELKAVLDKIELISSKFDVEFILSVSLDPSEIPDSHKEEIIVAL